MLALWLVDMAAACGNYHLVDHRSETRLTVLAASINRPGVSRWLTLRADDPYDIWVDEISSEGPTLDITGDRVLDVAADGRVLHRGASIGSVRGDEIALGARTYSVRLASDGPASYSERDALRIEVREGAALVLSGRAEPWDCFSAPRTAADDRADVLQRLALLLAWTDGVAAAEARR
jgi:hypothetical protein